MITIFCFSNNIEQVQRILIFTASSVFVTVIEV